jgi:tripartite-type tricarboxylate transporter receptor subunit TctC
MSRTFRAALGAALLGALGVGAAAHAQADTYPTRAVRLVIPFGAGGIADIHSRLVAAELSKRLGQQVYVENQPGGFGIPAARTALTAPPDGHTLTLFANGTATSVSLLKDLTFDPLKDFTPVANVVEFEFLMVVNAQSKYRSVGDVLTDAKQRPGAFKIGTTAQGSSSHLAAVLLRSSAGVDLTVVPYRNPADLPIALLRNDVDMVLDTLALLKGTIDDGKARPIAVTGSRRSAALPHIPTAQEGGLAGYEVTSWNGIFARAGVPAPVIERLNREIRATVAMPEIKQRLLQLGLLASSGPPEDLRARLQSDIAKWAKVIADAGIERR